jgi:hypothetical protein
MRRRTSVRSATTSKQFGRAGRAEQRDGHEQEKCRRFWRRDPHGYDQRACQKSNCHIAIVESELLGTAEPGPAAMSLGRFKASPVKFGATLRVQLTVRLYVLT